MTWRDEAACRGVGADLFYPESHENAGPAKAVCARCPVRQECLDYALAIDERRGVWGGLSPQERARLKRRKPWTYPAQGYTKRCQQCGRVLGVYAFSPGSARCDVCVWDREQTLFYAETKET